MKAMSWPSMMIWPSVGVSSPAIMRNSVVLPQPEGPSKAKNSFCAMSKETSSTAATGPKRLVMLRMEMIGSLNFGSLSSSVGLPRWRLQPHGDDGRQNGDDDKRRRD